MNKKIIIAVLIIFFLVLIFGVYYFTDFYHAQQEATKYLKDSGNVSINNTANGLLVDGKGNDTALILYPGAKIEYTSYLPLCYELANRGIDCYIVEMPLNIAFFGQNCADDIINNSNYSHYFLAGHSLGGYVASSYVNHTNNTDGLILLAAYSTDEIYKPVLSIYGSDDAVFDKEKYNESIDLYKNNFTEFVIEGGNHGQFGNYGHQFKDANADITSQNQQKQTADEIIEFINKII